MISFKSLNGPFLNEQSFVLENLPAGEYNLVGEIKDYNGDSINSEKIIISVN
jgi:hypothetical protein